jgi:membrane protein required for beta-lactamase induction
MTWLRRTLPASPVATDLYILAALSPLFLWDIVRNRRFHEAYVIWLAIYVPVALVAYRLWDTAYWHATARSIMGV